MDGQLGKGGRQAAVWHAGEPFSPSLVGDALKVPVENGTRTGMFGEGFRWQYNPTPADTVVFELYPSMPNTGRPVASVEFPDSYGDMQLRRYEPTSIRIEGVLDDKTVVIVSLGEARETIVSLGPREVNEQTVFFGGYAEDFEVQESEPFPSIFNEPTDSVRAREARAFWYGRTVGWDEKRLSKYLDGDVIFVNE